MLYDLPHASPAEGEADQGPLDSRPMVRVRVRVTTALVSLLEEVSMEVGNMRRITPEDVW
jgi:hypothetical protein